MVGAVELEDLSVEIRPKLPVSRVLFLLSYAFDPKRWRDTPFDFEERESLVEAIIPGFIFQVRRAVRTGVLQGYRQREEALAGVKGRILFDQQLQRRYGITPPVEVAYDDFTEDILPNQLLKAAVIRLQKLRLRHRGHRIELRNLLRGFAGVSAVEVAPHEVPKVSYTRLNGHYRPAVELARLILRSTSFDLGRGRAGACSFLVDMNKLFEDFVVVALREALSLGEAAFPQGARGRKLFLDSHDAVRLEPDLSWWVADQPVFVGDVKYKKLDVEGHKNADLYQLLAYTTAAGLDEGLLIYAAGEDHPRTITVPMARKHLHIVTLSLDRPPEATLAEVEKIAGLVRSMRAGAIANSAAAAG